MLKSFQDLGIVTRNSSGEEKCVCPQCSPHRKKKFVKCLNVNHDKGVFHCWHCDWSGTLKAGVKDQSNPYAWTRREYIKPVATESDLPKKVLDWFAARGITASVLNRNKIGYGPVYMPQVESEVNAIQFPFYRGGELVNIKYRDGAKNFRMVGGAERILYGMDDIAATTIFVEGEIDKLSLEVAGFRNVLSVPDGAPSVETKNYSNKFDYLDSAQEALSAVTTFVIAVDSDAPGQKLEDELARRLGRERCMRVIWPNGCKDANEVLTKLGVGALQEAIDSARPFPIKGVFDVVDLSDKIDRLYEQGWEKGLSTGWKEFDSLYTVRAGEMTVISGIPNSGKSNWLDALVVNLGKQHGWRFALFSPENQPLEDHMGRMAEKWAGQPFSDGPTPRMDRDTLARAKRWVSEHFTWILPDDDSDWTLEGVLDRAKLLVFRKGIRGLVIDPWNELEHLRPANLTETEYISQSLKRIRNFGRQHGVHMFIVVHPTKLQKDQNGNYCIPTLYDCAGSAHWRNKADNGLIVWRDFRDHAALVQIHVQKIRFRQIGKLGLGQFRYDPATGRYIEPSNYSWNDENAIEI